MFSEDFLQKTLADSLKNGGDYADIFFEQTADTTLRLDAGKIKTINTGQIQGAGIRVIYGRKYVYVYASNVNELRLTSLAQEIASAVKWDQQGNLGELALAGGTNINPIQIYPDTVSLDKKVQSLMQANAAARDFSSKISEVTGTYWDNDQNVIVATSEGRFIKDRRTRTRMAIASIASEGDKKETGFFGPGKSLGFELFDRYTPESIAKEASRIACLSLEADYAPQGKMPVVIDNAFGGVIFHEACGHALEANGISDDASAFCGKMGTKIASEVVTAIDDGTQPNEWGSSNFDDEAHPTQKNVLIEDGILKSYMVDQFSAMKMGIKSTGSGRKQSYKFAPTSRMTNTFIAQGKSTLDEMISSIDEGIYCCSMGGGSVNPPTTDFNFSVSEAYLIKNGKIDKAIKGAALIGKGTEILQNIEMVGDNLDYGTGMCGSSSGSIPANVGQPAIKVTGLVVGGREGGQ